MFHLLATVLTCELFCRRLVLRKAWTLLLGTPLNSTPLEGWSTAGGATATSTGVWPLFLCESERSISGANWAASSSRRCALPPAACCSPVLSRYNFIYVGQNYP